MFEWEIGFSKTTTTGGRIDCEMYCGLIYADTETEAREIFAENERGMVLDHIRRVPDGSGKPPY